MPTKLTINNIDLSRKNNCNIVTVESEYDKAMQELKDAPAYTVYFQGYVRTQNRYQSQREWDSLTEGEKEEARAGISKASVMQDAWCKAWVLGYEK